MPNFATKIELDDTLKELFLSFLLNEKYQVPTLSQEQEKLILHISEQFLFSGFVLNSCDFNMSQKRLVEQLKIQRRIQLQRQMSVRNDLNDIACLLNEKDLEHVFLKGSALNADGLYATGLRVSRDIDLLVPVPLLEKAFNALKSIGFKYSNQKTQDSVKYHQFGHHFPPLINKNNTILELHWRVTKSSDFKNCPVTKNIIANRRISNTNPNIFCPKIETTLAHLIHHSFKHHYMNLGPIFLFDMATIFLFFNKKWSIDNDLHNKLGIEENFELCKNFIERVSNESRFSSESKLMFDQIFKDSQWLRISDKPKTKSLMVKTTRIEILDNSGFLSKLLSKIRFTRTLYQVPYKSASFWLFLISDFLTYLKKVMRGSSN